MASVSGATSSLGNTALRGFGGLASGIDRDSLIEQLTAGTASKITKQKLAMTKLTWKQDAFRSISNKILDLQDNFLDFSAANSLKDPSFFAKDQITVMGDSNITKYIKASGTSDMIDYLSILGVKQLATSAQRLSDSKGGAGSITTGIDDLNEQIKTSKLEGMKLTFGTYNEADKKFNNAVTFTFPSSYTVKEGDKNVTKEIDYTLPPEKLVKELNAALKSQQFMSDKEGESGIEFKYDANTQKLSIEQTEHISDAAKQYQIRDSSSALEALGFDKSKLSEDNLKDGISLNKDNNEFDKAAGPFNEDTYIKKETVTEYLTGKSIEVSFGGQKKTIELIKEDEKANINTLDDLKKVVQKRLDKAFGSGKVVADTAGGELSFKTVDPNESLTVNAESMELRNVLGIQMNQSNKMSMDASLYYNRESLGFSKDMSEEAFEKAMENFTINGVKLEDITKDTTVNQLMTMINSNEEIGVRASYMENTNQFVLTAKDTGSGRKIELGGAAETIFGTKDEKNNRDGQDAKILVSYGNGIEREISSSSNSFELEGLTVTVSNTFGVEEKVGQDGSVTLKYTRDKAQEVTFSASADSEAVTEQVKKFIEAYNELIKDVNTQLTTKPNGSYGPLTDEQKAEMDKESIENWESKAKEGILFNNSIIRDLGNDLQGVLSGLMGSGVDSEALERIGISMSSDPYDGGTIKFDEAKFKAAMESEPELVSDIFTGNGEVDKGLVQIVEETLTPYATRMSYKNGGSYGRLIEEAGSEKVSLSLTKNMIYTQLEEMQETIDKLNAQLKTEQDRYISQFSQMEVLISQMNSQSGYLASMTG
ncbi:MAG: flagellar filament capping protein FliD [Clostridium sp.]